MRLLKTQKLAMELNDCILRLNTLLEDKPTDTSTSTGLHLLEIKNLSGGLKHIKDVKEYNTLLHYIYQKLHSYKDILISYIKDKEIANQISHIVKILNKPCLSY